MALLEVQKLTKTFGSTQAVKSITFSIEEGRCLTLLGPNGAGKTTTLRMLSGLLTPSRGSIQFAGVQQGEDIRKLIGYLPQYPVFYTWMTGKEYLVYVGQLALMAKKAAHNRAIELLAKVGLADAAKKRISGYSGGMKQRLGLAQAMMHQPKLVILDEPVSSLDPIGRREVLEMMREIKKETTILFSTHVLPDAEEISDDLLIMNGGQIVVAGSMGSVMDQYRQPSIRLRGETSLDTWLPSLSVLEGIGSVVCNGEYVELKVTDMTRGRSALIKLIAEQQIPIRKLEVAELSLEDIFMKAVSV
ncbi:MAG: ABC transporter ATP-binding protein [Paenibacillaceae bacterium]